MESSLLGVRDWFNRLLLSVSFAAQPSEGYTWFETCDRQLELVRYIGGLPESECKSWYSWADENFRTHALARAAALFRAKLTTGRPADEYVSWFLPAGAAFFAIWMGHPNAHVR